MEELRQQSSGLCFARAWWFLIALLVFQRLAPRELQSWPATASLVLIAGGLCVLLTDLFFLNVKTVAFTGDPTREQPNLAMNLLRYFTFFPDRLWIPVAAEPWIEAVWWHFGCRSRGSCLRIGDGAASAHYRGALHYAGAGGR